MLNITYKVSESINKTSVIVRDTTLLEDYTSEGISLPSNVVSLIFYISKYSDAIEYSYDITSKFSDFRDSNGVSISIMDLGIDTLEDGLYSSRIEFVENSTGSNVTHDSEEVSLFYGDIKGKVVNQNKSVDWKEYFGRYTDTLKTSLRKYNWLLNLEYAVSAGLYTEANKILTSLKRICQ